MIDEDAFRAGDVYIHYPYEDASFRYEKATGKVYKRFYGHPEKEIESSSASYRAAMLTGRLITREEYFDEAGVTQPVYAFVVEPATAKPPAGAEELLGKPVSELEAELHRLTLKSRMPPSAVRQFFETYALQARLADAAQRENAQRTFLIHAIVAYRKPELRLRPGEDLPVSDLTKIALAMPLKDDSLAAQRRQETLDDLLQVYEQETFKSEDRDFYRRLALAAFIRENASDPRMLGRPMSYAFDLGDVYIDFPYEDAKFRYEKATRKVYVRSCGHPENEIESSSALYHEAMSAGKLITREEYFRD